MNRRQKLKAKTAHFLERFLIPSDFAKVKKLEVKKVEGKPTIKKTQPVFFNDNFTGIESSADIFVTDGNGTPLNYEIEHLDLDEEEAVIWVHKEWVRDGTVQAQILYGDCKHPWVNKLKRKIKPVNKVWPDAAAVHHLYKS